MLDCLVVGAGAAGIAAGRSLVRSGLRFKILEAQAQPGGRTQSINRRGFVLDRGAAFLASSYTRTLALAGEAGLSLRRPGIRPGHGGLQQALLVAGRYHPHNTGSALGFLGFPLVPAAQKLRAALVLLRTILDRSLDVADAARLAANDGEDARSWAKRALGVQAYEFFVRLAFEPFFFYEAAEACAPFAQAVFRAVATSHLLVPHGGMGALCTALAENLPVQGDARVASIDWDGKLFVVQHESGAEYAATVILAVPPPAIQTIAVQLEDADATCLRNVRFAPSVRLNLGYERRGVLYPPVITPAGPGRHPVVGINALSVWLPAHAPAGKEVLQIRASAWRSEELLGRSAADITNELVSDCTQAGVHIPAADWVDVMEDPHAIVRTPPGHFTGTQDFLHRDRNGLYFAGDWLTGSTIEGAVRSGEAAAQRVKAQLQRAGS